MNLIRFAALVCASVTIGAITLSSALAQGPYKITLAGGSVGGAWSAIGTAIGETIKTQYPGSAFTYEPGREAGNLLLTSTGKVQLGIAHAQMALRAQKGLDPFNKPLENIRAIAMIDPQAAVQILATRRSGIESLDQIRTNKMPIRVSLNQKGTLMAITGEAILRAYGISVRDIESWGGRVTYNSYNTGLEQIKNNQADMIINMLAFPSSQINNAARDTELRLIGLGAEAAEKLNGELGTQSIIIPADTYAFDPSAIQTIRGSVIMIASTQMADQEAQDIVRAMLTNFDFLQRSHATLSRLTPKALTETAPIELHPGARKAYQAVGLIP